MILVKGLQRYQRSKLGVKKISADWAQFKLMRLGLAVSADIFFTSNFDL